MMTCGVTGGRVVVGKFLGWKGSFGAKYGVPSMFLKKGMEIGATIVPEGIGSGERKGSG